MEVTYNKYKKPPILKQGQKVVYELVNIRKDALDPEKKRLAIPVKREIQNRQRVFDADINDYIDIAFIESFSVGGRPVFGHIYFEADKSGKIILKGGNPTDQRKYEFMERSNENLSNPNRVSTVQAVFKRKDYAKERLEKKEKRSLLVDAIKISESMTDTMMSQIAVALNFKDDDKDQLKARIEDYAYTFPEKFIALTENKDLSIMEVADTAIKKGFILVNKQHRKITSASGEMLIGWGTGEVDVNPAEKFVSFVKSDEGSKFYEELKQQMKKK